MVRAKGSTGHMKTIDPYGSGDSLGFYDREKYKYVAAEMLVEFGVDILYHATLSSVQMESSRVTGITVAAKSGDLLPLHAHVVVDATGDGDVAVMAGENYVLGDAVNHKMSPSSSMFEMANVDTGRVYQYILDHPDDFEFKSDIVPMREFDERLRQKYFVGQGFKQLVRQAVEKGELSFGRDSVIVLNGIHPNTMHFNATRICGKNATDVVERSESELDGRRQIESVSEFMIQYVPGFEHAFVSVTGSEVGVRETRHIEGLYTLTGQDAYEGRKFEDSVSRGYFPIDLHNPDGATGYGNGGVWMVLKDTFDIPYRSLVPKHIDGLLLSGRCISGTSEAHGSYRTQGGIMGIGQAAGAAAAVCVRNQAQPRQQDVKEIQAALDQLGGLYRRDEARARKEKARARAITQAYIKSQNGRLITDKAILASYED